MKNQMLNLEPFMIDVLKELIPLQEILDTLSKKSLRFFALPKERLKISNILTNHATYFNKDNLELIHQHFPTMLSSLLTVMLLQEDDFRSNKDVFENVQKFLKSEQEKKEKEALEKEQHLPKVSTPVVSKHIYSQTHLHFPYILWEGDDLPVSAENRLDKKIIFRLFKFARPGAVLGKETTGHATLQIGDIYLSFYRDVDNLASPIPDTSFNGSLINSAANTLHIPKAQSYPGRWATTLQQDLARVGTDYSSIQEVTLDCALLPGTNFVEMRATALELKNSDNPLYHFYSSGAAANCLQQCLDVLRAGNIKIKALTPLAAFEVLKNLASQIEQRKFPPQIETELTWQETFRFFSIRISSLDWSHSKYYLELERKAINLPLDPRDWFKPNVFYKDFADFIRHMLILSLGISRFPDITLEQKEAFIQGVKSNLAYYRNNSQFNDAVAEALMSIIRKFEFENQNIAAKEARAELIENFRKLVKPHEAELFPPITLSSSSAEIKSLSSSTVDSNPAEASSSRDASNSTDDGAAIAVASSSMDTHTISSATLSDMLFLQVQHQEEAYGFTKDEKDALTALYCANLDAINVDTTKEVDDLRKLLGTLLDGIGHAEETPSFSRLQYIRYSIWRCYDYQQEWKDPKNITTLKISPDFFKENRDVLRGFAGKTVLSLYYGQNNLELYNASCNAFGFQPVAQLNCTLPNYISTTLKDIFPAPKNAPGESPAFWKFSAKSEWKMSVFQKTSREVIDLLDDNNKTPIVKLKEIKNLIANNKPAAWNFWDNDLHKRYKDLEKKANLALINEAFFKGYITEDVFHIMLTDHANTYSCKATHELVAEFKKVYTKYVDIMLQQQEILSKQGNSVYEAATEHERRAVKTLSNISYIFTGNKYRKAQDAMNKLAKNPQSHWHGKGEEWVESKSAIASATPYRMEHRRIS